MRQTGKPKYYWDSCIFIAWLQNEPREPEVVEGIEEVVAGVHNGRSILCTSVLTQTEVLESRLPTEAAELFKNIFRRRNVVQIDVDPRIAARAREIREYYASRSIKIRTPDSIHLATAILYKVDEFHTFDGSGKRQRPSDILALNGNVAGYPLVIIVPRKLQISLLTGIGPMQDGP
jgi:predicted nucleic acid-binding protein